MDVGAPARWVSIRRACELLGVNQATLRHWTDAGKVRAYVTPGGHRRYLEDDLHQLTEAAPTMGASLSAALLSSRERYGQIERRGLPDHDWLHSLDPTERQHFRTLGASMLHQLTAFVLAGTKRERERSLRDGSGVAVEYGQMSARLGLSLHDAMQAFLFFRNPVVESVTRWFGDQSQRGPRVADALIRVNQFMDHVLLAMTRAHEDSVRPGSS
ncbi:MAG: MerR family transcriptional regulator [Chloroflexota bacterium]